MPKDIQQLVGDFIAKGLDGYTVDKCVRALTPSFLSLERPVVAIPMNKADELMLMLRGASVPHLFCEGGVFHFNALYPATDSYPAARIYFFKSPYLDEIGRLGAYLKAHGMELPLHNSESFGELIQISDYPSRFTRWHKSWQRRTGTFMALTEGRIQNTEVAKGVWLESDGCLFCGVQTSGIATSTILGEKGLMIGARVCDLHRTDLDSKSTLIDKLADWAGVPAPFGRATLEEVSIEQAIASACETLVQALDCQIEKIFNQTITARRKSGFSIIVRHEEWNNYAYNISNPSGEPISRIDSADHHNVDFGPAHLHRDLRMRRTKKVESSFTYGFLLADAKLLRSLVEAAEREWDLRR